MEDLLKNFLYAGIGLVSVTAEKVQGIVDELIEKGRLTDIEGKKIVEDFLKSTESTKEDLEDRLKNITTKVVSTFDVRELQGVGDLEDRLSAIEAKLGIKTEIEEKVTEVA